MIKLIRNIRKKLIAQGKTTNYIKYALGEIILVMIGILLALQVNNWNENKKERKVETKLLNEIHANLKRDYQNLNIKIEETNRFKIANRKILEHLENKMPLNDSLKCYYSLLNAYGNFRAITAGYENLKSKGVGIIINDSLRSSILELYDYQYFHFVEDITYAIEDFRANKSEYLSNHIYTYSEGNLSRAGIPYDLNELQNNRKFKGYLKSTMLVHDWMNGRRTTGLKKIEEVMLKIENELETRK